MALVIEYVLRCVTAGKDSTVATYRDGYLYGPDGVDSAAERAAWHLRYTAQEFPRDRFALYRVAGDTWTPMHVAGPQSVCTPLTRETLTDVCNDVFQGTRDAYEARTYLSTLRPATLRGLADLNLDEMTGSKATIIDRLVADRHPKG